MRIFRNFLAISGLLLLAACFAPSKADLLKKAKDVSSRQELESALGEPSEVSKVGPIEKWTYQASDGEVIFIIVMVDACEKLDRESEPAAAGAAL